MCKALSSEAVIRQIEVVVIDGAQMRATLFGQDDVVETDAVALRIDVQFSDGIGLIAAAAKRLRQSWKRGHGFKRFKQAVAVRLGWRARHERAACGDTHWTFAVGIAEARAAACQFV